GPPAPPLRPAERRRGRLADRGLPSRWLARGGGRPRALAQLRHQPGDPRPPRREPPGARPLGRTGAAPRPPASRAGGRRHPRAQHAARRDARGGPEPGRRRGRRSGPREELRRDDRARGDAALVARRPVAGARGHRVGGARVPARADPRRPGGRRGARRRRLRSREGGLLGRARGAARSAAGRRGPRGTPARSAQPARERGQARLRRPLGLGPRPRGERRPEGRAPRRGSRAGRAGRGPAAPVRAVLPRPRDGERQTGSGARARARPPRGRSDGRYPHPRRARGRRQRLRDPPAGGGGGGGGGRPARGRGARCGARRAPAGAARSRGGMSGGPPQPPRILLVEDEPSLVLALTDRLASEGYAVESATAGDEALARALGEPFDLIVLDVMLPGLPPGQTGFDVCRELRQRGLEVPILMLTARSQVVDRVVGLKLGADDYLTKPFEAIELSARIEALLRRARPARSQAAGMKAGGDRLAFGDVEVDFRRAEVRRGGRPVNLSALELK